MPSSFYAESKDRFVQAVTAREQDLCEKIKATQANDNTTAVTADAELVDDVNRARQAFIKAITSYPAEHAQDVNALFTLDRAHLETVKLENTIRSDMQERQC